MRLSDPDGWAQCLAANPVPDGLGLDPADWPTDLTLEQQGDCYGAVVPIAAERWAEEMEQHLDAGATIADCAERSFSAVDRDLGPWGLTGFQYGTAVLILAHVWEHGEELRRWHNLDTQIGTEGERANETGGVLNPALLNLGTGDQP